MEDVTANKAKVDINEFLEKIKQEDPESYEYFEKQKEILMDTLHELLDYYEVFAYKNYEDYESFEKIIDSLSRLYDTLDTFDKVKHSTSQILRLIEILRGLDESSFGITKVDAFDMLEFLLNDIKQFIFDMFIEKNVKDVTYFRDSIKENITAFEMSLNEEEDDDEEIEFL